MTTGRKSCSTHEIRCCFPAPAVHRRRRSPCSFGCPFFRGRWDSCPSFSPPNRALPSIASADCHCHCTPPSSSHSATSTAQIRSKIPAAAQRWNQSWTVLLGPYRSGNGLPWQPLRIRKMIALSIFRQLATLRPVGFLGQNSTRIGSILRHNSSEISQIVPSGLRRGFRRTMAQSPIVVPASSHFSLQTPFCKRYSAGSRIVSSMGMMP
jgi:hypothetical protein